MSPKPILWLRWQLKDLWSQVERVRARNSLTSPLPTISLIAGSSLQAENIKKKTAGLGGWLHQWLGAAKGNEARGWGGEETHRESPWENYTPSWVHEAFWRGVKTRTRTG